MHLIRPASVDRPQKFSEFNFEKLEICPVCLTLTGRAFQSNVVLKKKLFLKLSQLGTTEQQYVLVSCPSTRGAVLLV